jgi:hypothetical protein
MQECKDACEKEEREDGRLISGIRGGETARERFTRREAIRPKVRRVRPVLDYGTRWPEGMVL